MQAANLDPRDPALRRQIESLLGSDASIQPDSEDVVRRIATEAAEPLLRAHAQVVLAANVRRQGRTPEAEGLYREGLAVLRGTNTHAELRGCVNFALSCLHGGRVLEALVLTRRAASIAKLLDEHLALALAHGHAVGTLIDLGDPARAQQALAEMEAVLPKVPAERRTNAARRAAAYALELAAERGDADAATAAAGRLAQLGYGPNPRAEPWARGMAKFAAEAYSDALASFRQARTLVPGVDRDTHAFHVYEVRCLFALGATDAVETARVTLDKIESTKRDVLPPGRRMRFAERIGALLHEHGNRPDDTAYAFDIAGEAALERLGEIERFLEERPAFLATDDDEEYDLRRYRDRVLAEHRALLRAFGRMVGEDAVDRDGDTASLCICAWCHAVRGPDRVWLALAHVPLPSKRIPVSHGMCNTCRERYRRGGMGALADHGS